MVYYSSFLDAYFLFFRKAPAFLLGIIALCGLAFYFTHSSTILIGAALLLLPLGFKKEKKGYFFLAIFLALFSYFYTKDFYPHKLPTKAILNGHGYLSISSKSFSTYFKPTFVYKGILTYFKSDEGVEFYNIPTNIYLDDKKEFQADADFFIKGKLVVKDSYLAILKLDKKRGLTKIPNTHSFAEKHYHLKQIVVQKFSKHLKEPKVANFLTALVTGELDDKLLKFHFCKLGLQHILAISGFHFATLVASCFLLLRLFRLPNFLIQLLLLVIINIYFLFLGLSPSILRAYLAIEISLISLLFQKRYFALNALGIGLLVELLLNPLTPLNIGFQLSFLATFALIAISPILESGLALIFKKRSLYELNDFSHLSIYGYLLSSFLRKSFALSIAVNLPLFPVILWHFNTFPLISLFYNLFFPLAVSFSIFLLLLATLFSPLPYLFSLLFTFNNFYTKQILDLVTTPPLPLQINIFGHLPFPFIIVFLFLLLFATIYFSSKSAEEFKLPF